MSKGFIPAPRIILTDSANIDIISIAYLVLYDDDSGIPFAILIFAGAVVLVSHIELLLLDSMPIQSLFGCSVILKNDVLSTSPKRDTFFNTPIRDCTSQSITEKVSSGTGTICLYGGNFHSIIRKYTVISPEQATDTLSPKDTDIVCSSTNSDLIAVVIASHISRCTI